MIASNNVGYAQWTVRPIQPDGSPEIRILRVNHAFQRITGFVPSSQPSLALQEFPKSWPGELSRLCLVAATTLEEGEGEYWSPLLQRRYRVHVWRDHEGTFSLMLVDITAYIDREKLLSAWEQNYRNFFDTMEDMVVVTTLPGEILYVNQSLVTKLGYTREELGLLGVLDIHPPDRQPEARKIFADMALGLVTFCPIPIQKKNGEPIPVETRVSPGVWDGKPCLFGVIKDLSTEQELHQRFEILFRNNPALMMLTSFPDHRLMDANNSFLGALGYTLEEVLGRTSQDLQLFPEGELLSAAVDRLEREGRVSNVSLKIKTKAGEARQVLYSGEVLRSQTQAYFLIVMIDITDRRTAERELAESERRLSLTMDAAGDGLWDWEVETGQVVHNRRWCEIVGLDDSKLHHTIEYFSSCLHPEDKDPVFQKVQRAMVPGGRYESEHRMIRPDGGVVFVHDRGAVTTWSPEGKPLHMMGSIQDITSRKIVDDELASLTELQRTLMEIASRFISVPLDRHDGIINEALERLGRFTFSDRSYVFSYDFTAKTCSNTYEWCAEGITAQKEALQDVPLEGLEDWIQAHTSGRTFYIPDVEDLDPRHALREILEPQGVKSLIALPMMDGSKCLGFVGFDAVRQKRSFSEKEQTLLQLFALMLVNLFKRAQAQEELFKAIDEAQSANRAKSEFLANMSHEIRTPLNSVIGFTDLLRTTPLNPVQQQFVDNANVSGHVLLDLINDILDFSKIEAGMLQLEILETDLWGLLEECLDLVRLTAAAKGVELLLDVMDDIPPRVKTDPLRLRQILSNLLSNGVKFTQEGEVELRVRWIPGGLGDGKIHFSVRDTGIGIPEDRKERLFKAFSQADSSTTRRFGGTGLGLIISQMIAVKLGSTISLDSQEGKGTTFSFTLPVTLGSPRVDAPTPALGGLFVLVVGHPKSLEIISRQMTALGSRVEGFPSGREALERLKTGERPDGILCDFRLRDSSGLEFYEKLSARGGKGSLPPFLLLHSSTNDPEFHRACDRLGISHRLVKPVKRNALRQAVSTLLNTGDGRPDSRVLEAGEAGKTRESSEGCLEKLAPRILIAEDVKVNLKLLTAMLGQLCPQARVYEAPNGREALKIFRSVDLDVILMDVQMPEMDGLEASRQIRKLESPAGRRTPIVALTAGAFQEDKALCLQAGMDVFLSKPVTLDSLKAVLGKILVP